MACIMEEEAEECSTYREKHMKRHSIRKDRGDSSVQGPTHRTFLKEHRFCQRGEETHNHGKKWKRKRWRMNLER